MTRINEFEHVTVEDVMEYLDELGVSMWADWYVDDPARRRLAAEWLLKEVENLAGYVEWKRKRTANKKPWEPYQDITLERKRSLLPPVPVEDYLPPVPERRTISNHDPYYRGGSEGGCYW